jgi:hypothetical protein
MTEGSDGAGARRALLNPTFDVALARLPTGYLKGSFTGRTYGVTVTRSEDGKRTSLFAEELGGKDIVSFNLYSLGSGEEALRPCEMSSDKVIDFVVGLVPE